MVLKNKLIIGLILLSSFAFSEKVGLGFEIHTFPSSAMEGAPFDIYIPTKTEGFLLEPKISYTSQEVERNSNDSATDEDYTEKTINVSISLGIFKLYTRDKLDFYVGARIGTTISRYEIEYADSDYGVDDEEEEESLIIAPTVGAEYNINDKISVGGEVMYLTYKNEDNESSYTITETNSSLQSRLIIRFYF